MVPQSVCVQRKASSCVCVCVRTMLIEGSHSTAKQHVPFSGAELLRMELDTSEVFATQTDILIMPLLNSKKRINADL